MTVKGMRSLAFLLRDVAINVLTICCQIPGMRNLAFSLRDVTINDLSCVFHIRFTLHVVLFVRVFLSRILIASVFLNSQESIRQGHDQFRDKSREQQEQDFFFSFL